MRSEETRCPGRQIEENFQFFAPNTDPRTNFDNIGQILCPDGCGQSDSLNKGGGVASVRRPRTLISIWNFVSCVRGLLSPASLNMRARTTLRGVVLLPRTGV